MRIILGFVSTAVWAALAGPAANGWTIFPFFLLTLIALRVVPAVVRKLVPFSAAAQARWAEQRQLAKRFDSYQWRKLFWMGLGQILFVWQSGLRAPAVLTLAAICTVSGGLGLAMWRRRSAQVPKAA